MDVRRQRTPVRIINGETVNLKKGGKEKSAEDKRVERYGKPTGEEKGGGPEMAGRYRHGKKGLEKRKRRSACPEIPIVDLDQQDEIREEAEDRKDRKSEKCKKQIIHGSHERGKRPSHKKGRNRLIPAACAALFILLAAGGILTLQSIRSSRRQAQEAVSIRREREEEKRLQDAEEQAKKETEDQNELFGYSVESGKDVFSAIRKRPPFVELTDDNTSEFAQIVSCAVDKDTKGIRIKAEAKALPQSDDKFYYVFSLRSYEEDLSLDAADCLAKEYQGTEVEFRLPRRCTTRDRIVFDRLVLAVKKDGKYVAVSRPHYITNPESQAGRSVEGPVPSSKKGLLVDPNKLRSSEWDDLGVQHAAYNIMLSRILGASGDGIHPTIQYSYNGKTYLFNGQVMSEYDLVFSTLTRKGIAATAILLNDVSGSYPQLIHPKARSGIGSAPYYAFNGSDEAGAECLAAVGAFLAERYSNAGNGIVSRWIIGNEINARKEWNYMEYTDLASYVTEYAKAFRIFYNAIKSTNAAAQIYISLDQQWDRNLKNSKNYDARDVLDEFNRQMKEEGNVDWGLAIHPYNVPLTSAKTWAASKYVKHSADTSMLTMNNIQVVTDYMNQETFLTEEGQVRPITLSELGYTSSKGEQLQAAAIVYAYKRAEADPDIDSILFSRETDAMVEIAQGLSLGLNHADGSHKYAWNVYRYMDTGKKEEYTDFAKGLIGIGSWSEIMK